MMKMFGLFLALAITACGGVSDRGYVKVEKPEQSSQTLDKTNPTKEPKVPEKTAPEPGPCLLEYNSALVPSGSDACCLREGEAATCDQETQCNELSGAGCCVIYATNATTGGAGCCMYVGGKMGETAAGDDRTVECTRLLSL